MGKLKKLLALTAIVLTAGVNLSAQTQEEMKSVPGAALMVYDWSELNRPAPDADPITAVVDKATAFSKGNLRSSKESQKFLNKSIFLVWTGFVSVPQAGTYTFSMAYESNNGYPTVNNTILQVNRQDLLVITKTNKGKPYGATSVTLEKGNYEITLIHRADSNHDCDVTVQMWNRKNPLKKTFITPAVLYHAE